MNSFWIWLKADQKGIKIVCRWTVAITALRIIIKVVMSCAFSVHICPTVLPVIEIHYVIDCAKQTCCTCLAARYFIYIGNDIWENTAATNCVSYFPQPSLVIRVISYVCNIFQSIHITYWMLFLQFFVYYNCIT